MLAFVPFLIFGLTNIVDSFYGLIAFLVVTIGLILFIIIDAVSNARKQKEYVPKSYNTVSYHLLFAVGMMCVNWIVDARSLLGLQFYSIATTSNNPTLQVGDWVVSKKNAYQDNKPDYGDLVAFNSPKEGIWIFRVVGLPGDIVALNHNIVSINSKACKATFVRDAKSDGDPVSEFIEELPNGHQQHIYMYTQPYDTSRINIPPTIVASGSYFLLGDNRDNAFDSKFYGAVKKEDIVGRLIYGYWGKTPSRININLRDK